MHKQVELDEFKQQVADYFNQRSNYDSEGEFHPRLAHSLVEYAEIRSGQRILDIATGTGLVAIEAAQLVGSEGWVVGVDVSPVMLSQAKSKIEAAGLSNIEFLQADAETVNFPDANFDTILCCSALVYLRDIPAALRRWHQFVKPNGLIGINGFAETAFFITGIMVRTVAKRYGVTLPVFNQATGTAQKCSVLLQNAGFKDIEVKIDQLGSYISLSQAQGQWEKMLKNPFCRPLRQLSAEQLEQLKAECFAELEALITDKGIWNDATTFSAFGRKGVG